MIPKTEIKPTEHEFALLSKLVTKAFGQRRKMLVNALSTLLDKNDFAELGVDCSVRAENISLEGFVTMADYLNKKKRAAQVRR